jgi:tetratricopeptide (TPR) repeat protein
MDTLMPRRSWPGAIVPALWWLLLVAAPAWPVTAPGQESEPGSLQRLLTGEALFLSRQQNHLDAIVLLRMAEEQGLISLSERDTRMLLARMKLAYGLTLDAGFDFHALLGADVPPIERNRAWIELAFAFTRKGYHEAALETLEQIRGPLPREATGDYQLLHAGVLMSLDRNLEAARILEHWQGSDRLAAYADYNHGIALLRAGQAAQAVPVLVKAAGRPARGEEFLALRDKARLSLGYVLASQKAYDAARKALLGVRPESPFANRALLALGWIAHKQGHSDTALATWMKLRDRSLADPAVLEALFVLPAMHRELDALDAASQGYEQAVVDYDRELGHLQKARHAVQQGDTLPWLLPEESTTTLAGEPGDRPDETRYLGSLLASREFRQLAQGHDDLRAMLQTLDKDLQALGRLAKAHTHAGSGSRADAPSPADTGTPDGVQPRGAGPRPVRPPPDARSDAPRWRQEWRTGQGDSTEIPPPGIPSLPEVDLPADRERQPLPQPEFIGLPESDFSGLPPESEYRSDVQAPEVVALPESEIRWLPETGRFRMPDGNEEDFAHPDHVPRGRTRPGDHYAYLLNRLLPVQEDEARFDPGAVPVGDALRQLAVSLQDTGDRAARLGESFAASAEFQGQEERVATLQSRILHLRARIEQAIERHEQHTRSLALEVLDRRRILLEGLLEQASLERAKSYDQTLER